MTRVAPSAFPALRRVFGGYLHEDVLAEHGSAEAAFRAFRAEASPADSGGFERHHALSRRPRADLEELRAVLSSLAAAGSLRAKRPSRADRRRENNPR